MIENDHLDDWSPEKDCCWPLTFRQPVRKPKINHLTLNMASAQVVETSVANNSPSQDSSHREDHFQSRNNNNDNNNNNSYDNGNK